MYTRQLRPEYTDFPNSNLSSAQTHTQKACATTDVSANNDDRALLTKQIPVQAHSRKYTSRRTRNKHTISNIVQPKPNIPRIEVHSIMHSPKSPTAASDPKTTAFEHSTSQKQKRESRVHLKGLANCIRSQNDHKPATARHFTSATSSTDYTEGRKARLIYGH
jgi:hypothetical protein